MATLGIGPLPPGSVGLLLRIRPKQLGFDHHYSVVCLLLMALPVVAIAAVIYSLTALIVSRQVSLWRALWPASSFECRGDAARGILDRGASSAFVMAANELAGFVSQLRVQSGLTTFIPGNSQLNCQCLTGHAEPAPAGISGGGQPTAVPGFWVRLRLAPRLIFPGCRRSEP